MKMGLLEESRHPLFGTSFSNWIYLVFNYHGIDKRFLFKALFITFSIILFTPIRIISYILYNNRISRSKIRYPPVFIIGHWRSGTTYLHELLSQDPRFTYTSLWQTLIPNGFIVLEEAKKFLSKFLPTTRPMDNVKVDIDGPYEEEAGIAALNPWSFFHCFIFPKDADRIFRESVLFDGLNKKEIERWKENYLWFLKAATYTCNGKQLLLKNPANTARIKILLELFPDARFIHIYRNPYKVFVSTRRMRTRVLEHFALQDISPEELEEQFIRDYIRLMKTFFEDKKLIPREHLVEVRYEDLVEKPMEEVKRIYKNLGLSLTRDAEESMRRYLDKQADYKTNIYTLDREVIEKVEKNWGFTIKLWNYNPPEN